MQRRAQLVEDPRYCRFVHEDGDGLPGLVVDRFDRHFSIQTTTRSMDARIEEVARVLMEIADARSVLLRNDSTRRSRVGLDPERSGRVLEGTPPRWTRVLELSARLSVDLQKGPGTGYNYSLRELRRIIARLSPGAVVLDPACLVGGTAVQAGLHGARRIIAFAPDADDLDLARENLEANGMMHRASIEQAQPLEALRSIDESFDLVVLHAPTLLENSDQWAQDFDELVQHSVKATRHGGYLVLAASGEVLGGARELEESIMRACAETGRIAYRLIRAAAPVDFPALVGSPYNLFAIAIELS
jgi:23S rRNA (cytosine1962-C5)-methyltransferase